MYLDRNEEIRDVRRDARLMVDCLDMLSGAGTCRLLMLPEREILSGVMSPRPGSGGSGLFLLALSAIDMVLFMLLGTFGNGWSKTPAAAGDIMENARLALRCSTAFSKSVSEVKLDIEEVGL